MRNAVPLLRYVSLAEGASFLILLVCSAVKAFADQPLGVKVFGPIHGVLFIAFVLLVLNVRGDLGWGRRHTLLALLAGVVPTGAFVLERRLRAGATLAP